MYQNLKPLTPASLISALPRTIWRVSIFVYVALFSAVTSLPLVSDSENDNDFSSSLSHDDQSIQARWRRNAVTGSTSSTTTSAPEVTTLTWLEKATPYIYIIPPIVLGIPLLCCLCCCLKSLPCCGNDTDDEVQKLAPSSSSGSHSGATVSGGPHSSRVAPAPPVASTSSD